MDVRHTFFRHGAGRGRALVGLTVGALIAGIGVGGVVAATPAAAGVADYRNLIVLQTGTTNAATLYDSAGATTVQGLASTSSSNCTIKSNSSVVTLGTNSAKAGLRAGSIGVVDKTSGESCGQVNGELGETLVVDLNGQKALSAVLDIEAIKDVVIQATATSNGTNSRNFYLYSGNSDVSGAPTGYFACNPGSTSSAPNSGPSDNCKWSISDGTPFDKLSLKAMGTSGQFSLEGGADWPGGGSAASGSVPDNATYFSLAVLCSNPPTTISFQSTSGGVSITDSYVRNGTNADGSPCFATSKTLSRAGDVLQLTTSAGQPFEQGNVTASWVSSPGVDALNDTEVNFYPTGAANYADGWVVMDWCPATIWDATANKWQITGLPSDPDQAAAKLSGTGSGQYGLTDLDGSPDNDLFQYACVYARSTTYVPSAGKFKTTDSIYLLGDVVWRG